MATRLAANSHGCRFRPGWLPSIAAVLGVAVLLALGTWQLQRLAWKEALIAQRDARLTVAPVELPAQIDDGAAWNFRAVLVQGRFRHDLEQLFGARTHQGRLGHQVLTPLVRRDGAAVLVDRGWVPADRAHPATRRETQVDGSQEITGIARFRAADRPGWFTPANQPDERLWYHYDLPAMEAALGLELLPVVVEARRGAEAGGLPVPGASQPTLRNPHLEYALTWYALAATLVAIYVAFGVRRGRERP